MTTDAAERQRKAIGLQTLLRKGRRHDPKKAKKDKYYAKARLLRSYHTMLKRELPESSAPAAGHTNGISHRVEEKDHQGDRGDDAEAGEVDMESADEVNDHPHHGEGVADSANAADDNRVVCKFYTSAKGCKRGMACEFRHVGTPIKKIRVCRFYTSRTGCRSGSKCMFVHEGTPQVVVHDEPVRSTMIATWEKKQDEIEEAQRQAKEEAEAKRKAIDEKRSQRKVQTSRLRQRTERGQPVMKGIINNLLDKIQTGM